MASPENQRRVLVVAQLLPHPPVGGGHKRTLRLVEAIERAGGVPHLLTPDPGAPGAAQELRERGWTVENTDEPPPTPAGRLSQHVRRLPSPYLSGLARRLGELAPRSAFVQIEHTQSAYYGALVDGTRSVLSLHNVDSELCASVARGKRPLSLGWLRAWNRALAMRSTERRAAGQSEALLCVSAHDRDYFEPLAERVLVVPNGVDDDVFEISPELPAGQDVLFFGQFDYPPNAHGILRFLREGWPRLAAARPEARLRLAGKGAPPELTELAARSERVELLGFVDDIRRELAASRVVLVPLWQGGGTRLKVVEALAAARPVVGTPLGVEEIGFEDGRHGLIADDPAGLANLAAALLADEDGSRRMARQGRELADGYRWKRVTAPAERLYREWLAAA